MKESIFNKAFVLGFLAAMASFIIFNIFTLSVPSETRFRHVVASIGFPLAFYEWGGDPYFERILYFGLAADVVIAIIYSILTGFLFGHLWRRETITHQ